MSRLDRFKKSDAPGFIIYGLLFAAVLACIAWMIYSNVKPKKKHHDVSMQPVSTLQPVGTP